MKFTNNPSADLNDILAKVKGSIDMWVTFLTRHDLLDRNNLPAKLNDPALRKALSVLEVMNFTPEERSTYEDHMKWLRIEESALKKHGNDRFEQGKAEGIEEGEQIIAQKTALKMLDAGFSTESVSEFTGLSMKELEHLKASKSS